MTRGERSGKSHVLAVRVALAPQVLLSIARGLVAHGSACWRCLLRSTGGTAAAGAPRGLPPAGAAAPNRPPPAADAAGAPKTLIAHASG